MARKSDNYYQRKCYLERNEVPTQRIIVNKMSPPLAKVYFDSMNYKLKVLAGLEPPMKGGGSCWYIPPEEVLKGRLVMQPLGQEYLSKLGYDGIALIGEQLAARHQIRLEEEKNKALLESDINWKETIEKKSRQEWDDVSKAAADANTKVITKAFNEFTVLYSTSIAKLEKVLLDAAIKEIQTVEQDTFNKMKTRYERLLKSQATRLYDKYTKKLNDAKEKLKEDFLKKVEDGHLHMVHKVHDIRLEKHVIVEKLRQLFESMNLACQVYVALKEQEECRKEMELAKHIQKKKVKALKEDIAMKNFQIKLALEKEKKRKQFNNIWKSKVCQIVKKFQQFAMFCLKQLPEQADFFINMEKLLMIQLSNVLENPTVDSVFEFEESFHIPDPRPHPFYLFCDRGYSAQPDQNLCPKHCTSSASQLPVVVINKRFIYSACDNFEKFTDNIKEYIYGNQPDDVDDQDNTNYDHYFPIKVTSSQQLLELNLQSSIMQILQQEIPNTKKVSIDCCVCKVPYCFCSPIQATTMRSSSGRSTPVLKLQLENPPIDPGKKIDTRSAELFLEREPKWESYMDYIMPKGCPCAKRAKKHLEDHLPPYMRNTSKYEEASLPNYEKCSLRILKKLVKKAQRIPPTPPPPERVDSKTHEISTQYSNPEVDLMCTCLSDEEITKFLAELSKGVNSSSPQTFKVVGEDAGTSHMAREAESFAGECAKSLRRLLDEDPQLQEIFKKEDCQF